MIIVRICLDVDIEGVEIGHCLFGCALNWMLEFGRGANVRQKGG